MYIIALSKKEVIEMGFDYPVTINLEDKRCIVVGGGRVALRKARTLLAAGAVITLISPEIINELQDILKREKRITFIQDVYQEKYINNCFLVIAATNDKKINYQVAQDCKDKNILVNVVDSLKDSDFIVNAHYKLGEELLFAVSTGGKNPALSAKIISEIKERYGEEYIQLVNYFNEIRRLLQEKVEDPELRYRLMREIVSSNIYEMLLRGSIDEAKKRVNEWITTSL